MGVQIVASIMDIAWWLFLNLEIDLHVTQLRNFRTYMKRTLFPATETWSFLFMATVLTIAREWGWFRYSSVDKWKVKCVTYIKYHGE